MATATTDIVARLQLRAEQFSSETGQAFANMKSRVRSTAAEVRESFGSAFADVQRLAQTSLQLPRTEAGSLNLAPQIAQLNSAANAAEQNAVALRELSIAQSAASSSAGAAGAALRLEADASAVAALAEERHAQEIREKIGALEAVQRELNQTTSATKLLTTAEEQTAMSARRGSGSFVMLGQQFNDLAVQIASGQSAAIAFAQQLPQATYALSQMGGMAGRVGGILTGGLGTAFTIVAVLAAPFVSKLWEGEQAAKAAALGADGLSEAQGVLGKMFDLTSGKLERQNELLVLNARLTAINLRAESMKQQADAEKTIGGLRTSSWGNTLLPAKVGDEIGAGPRTLIAALRAGTITSEEALRRTEKIDMGGSVVTRQELQEAIVKLAAAPLRKAFADKIDKSLSEGRLDPSLRRDDNSKKRTPKPKSTAARDEFGNDTEDRIAAMRDRFLDLPPAVRQVQDALREVDDMVRDLNRRQPEGFRETIKQAEALKPIIRDALNRPYRDYVDQQRQSLAVGKLVLEGRDAEAEALQATVRLQEQMGPLSDEQLQTVLKLAEQHQKITEALEDQRRIVGIYTAGVNDLQSTFDRFLSDLDGNTGSAFKSLIGGWLDDLKNVQRNLLSNAIFGGVDREVEKFVRQMTGKRTPAELIADQAQAAGVELRTRVNDAGEALGDFASVVRSVTNQIAGGRPGLNSFSAVGDGKAIGDAIAQTLVREAFDNVAINLSAQRGEVYDPNAIVVTGQIEKIGQSAERLINASDVLGITIDGVTENLRRNLGIEVPKEIIASLKSGLPTVLQGVGLGQLGGSVFSSITGGKDNKLASSLGGVLGNVAGKELGPAITKAIGGGLGKTLGGAAGPIGSIVGGVLGNLIGGLFNKPQYGTAILTNATDKVSAQGRGGSSTKAASGLAGSVQQGLTQLADQLGATLGNFDTVVGMFDGKYRVRTTAAGWDGKGALDFKGNSKNNLYDFGDDQQAAIQFAIADAVRDGAIQGLSAASSRILQSGQDLGKAVEKVTMIESIPKDLKAMLDPVGAAVDALNRKWQRTVDALKEGGASAEQMAQAQRLYDLQLQQTLNSTQAASATLKEYRDSLMLGSNSPYSLRDQEATAISKLQPYLDQIAAGQSIDQEKYRAAADAYLSVERELYGSTSAFFDALDTVQAATNRAINAIENVKPITPPVESPFAKATAANTQATAEMTEETNALLQRIVSRLDALGSNDGGSSFIGAPRNFNIARA